MKTPKAGTGRLQWNGGAWLGMLLGGTAWLAVAAVVLMRRDPALAIGLIGLLLLANVAGGAVWANRHRIRPYPAFRALLWILAFAALSAVIAVDLRGHLAELWMTGWPALDQRLRAAPWVVYAVLLVFPLLAFIMFLLEIRHRRSA